MCTNGDHPRNILEWKVSQLIANFGNKDRPMSYCNLRSRLREKHGICGVKPRIKVRLWQSLSQFGAGPAKLGVPLCVISLLHGGRGSAGLSNGPQESMQIQSAPCTVFSRLFIFCVQRLQNCKTKSLRQLTAPFTRARSLHQPKQPNPHPTSPNFPCDLVGAIHRSNGLQPNSDGLQPETRKSPGRPPFP